MISWGFSWEKKPSAPFGHTPVTLMKMCIRDSHDSMLLEKLEEIRQSRDDRNERMAKQLTAIGLPVSLEEVAHNAGGEIITLSLIHIFPEGLPYLYRPH